MSFLNAATQRCMQLFESVCAAEASAPTTYREQLGPSALENEYVRFKVWSGNLGARHSGHASLDWRLRGAEVMAASIRKLLEMLEENLTAGLEIITQSRLPYEEQLLEGGPILDDSDSDDSEDGTPELLQRHQTVVAIMTSLYKISFTLRRSGTRFARQKEVLYRELIPDSHTDFGDAYEPFDRLHVVDLLNDLRKASFESLLKADEAVQRTAPPDASECPLIDRLISAITKRRRKFRYWLRQKEKLVEASAEEDYKPHPVPLPNTAGSRPDGLPATEMRTQASIAQSHSPGPRTETEATANISIAPAQGDMVSIASSLSMTRDLEGHEVVLPKQPETDGGDFECPFCFFLCPAKDATKSRWRKHVLEDLQPYSCTYPECKLSDQLFGSYTAWLSHEGTYHRQIWRCRDHPKVVFATENEYHTHLEEFHPELNSRHRQAVIDSSVTSREDTRGQCPLCLISVTSLGGTQNLLKHIADHLERIACFAFPGNLDKNEMMNDADSMTRQCDLSGNSHRLSDFDSTPTAEKIEPSPLYLSCCEGSVGSVRMRLEEGADPNVQGGKYGNPIQAASVLGSVEIVRILLVHGADVNLQGGFHGTAIQAASFRGHEGVVRLLLDNGADINLQGGFHGGAIQAASSGGYEGVVQLLLDYGVNVDAQGGHFGNALQAASLRGHEAIVRLLLDYGVNVHAYGGDFGNALQAASLRGHEAVVRLLLDRVLDVIDQGEYFGNALEAASVEGHEAVVELLLDRRADVNSHDKYLGNALVAASRGHEAVVRLLLDRVLDINSQGEYFGNALEAASVAGHEAVVELLLDRRADVNSQDKYFGNALVAASVGGHEAVVELLLDRRADVNFQDKYFGNALVAASARGSKAVVRLLLDKEAFVNARREFHSDALQAASAAGHQEIVQLLLDKGAGDEHSGRP